MRVMSDSESKAHLQRNLAHAGLKAVRRLCLPITAIAFDQLHFNRRQDKEAGKRDHVLSRLSTRQLGHVRD